MGELLFPRVRVHRSRRFSEQITDLAVEELELCDELGREPFIAFVNKRRLLTHTCQLPFQIFNAGPKRIAFTDKTLNRVGYLNKQKFDVLRGVQLLELSRFICFVHSADPWLHFTTPQ